MAFMFETYFINSHIEFSQHPAVTFTKTQVHGIIFTSLSIMIYGRMMDVWGELVGVNIMLFEEKDLPSYVQIQNFILDKIRVGEYKIGDKIPSEIELAKMFSVSRTTSNKAIAELANRGIVSRTPKKGTFISQIHNDTSSKAFSSAMEVRFAATHTHQLLRFQLIPAYPELAQKMNLSPDEQVYEIIRINGKQNSIDCTYLPYKHVEDLLLSADYLQSNYIHNYLHTIEGLEPRYMKIYINHSNYSFLQHIQKQLNYPVAAAIWSTNVYDKNMDLLSITYTINCEHSSELPLFTFLI